VNRDSLLGLAACAVVVAATFSDLLRSDRLPLYRDLLFFVLPMKGFLAEHLKRGELPMWNPYVYLGTPFFAALQIGVLYPLNALLLIPFPLGFNLFLFSQYAVALVGMFLFLRSRNLSVFATAVGAMVFTTGGCLVSLLGVTNHLQATAWIPWVLLACDRFSAGPSTRRLAVIGALLTVQILGGSPEMSLLTLTIGALWIAQRARGFRTILRAESALLVAFSLALCTSAAQILPTVEYLSESQRSGPLSYEQVSYWSLQPISSLQLLFPHSSFLASTQNRALLGPAFEDPLPFLQSIFLGLVPLCLIPAGIRFAAEGRFWAAILGGSVLLALGRHGPAFPLLYDLAPALIGRFRYPEKFLIAAHLAAAVLAADGAEQLSRGTRNGALPWVATMAATATTIGVLVFAIGSLAPETLLRLVRALTGADLPLPAFALHATDLLLKSRRLLLIGLAFLAVLWLWRRAALRDGIALSIVWLLSAVDLASVHHNLNLSVSVNELNAAPPVVDVAELRAAHQRIYHYQTHAAVSPGLGTSRAIAGLAPWQNPMPVHGDLRDFSTRGWRALFLDVGMMYKVPSAGGFDGIERRSNAILESMLATLPRDAAVRLLGTLGVSHLVGPDALDVPSVEAVSPADSGDTRVYRIRDSRPFAYLVDQLRAASSELEVMNVVSAAGFAPEREAMVEAIPPGWGERRPSSAADSRRVSVLTRDAAHVSLATESSAATFLVVNESYFPGWVATLDGGPVSLVRTNLFVDGIPVPAGSHRVDLDYRPASLCWGLIISLSGALVTLLLCVPGLAGDLSSSRHRSQEPGDPHPGAPGTRQREHAGGLE
jgi:hypothetical protein